MNGKGHRVLGAGAGVTYAAATGLPLPLWPVSGALGCATSNGWSSPDADQTWLRWLPGGHRGPTHWVGWPLILAAAVHVLGWPWWVGALNAGWASHLLGDFLVGERPWGVPCWPLPRLGLGAVTPGTTWLRTGGGWESFCAWTGASLMVWWVLGHPGGYAVWVMVRDRYL